VARHGLAQVRFYVDADTLGLAHVLAAIRSDVTYPGDPGATVKGRRRPPCPIVNTDTPDAVWIPEVARRGWVIITRDKAIDRRPGEKRSVLDNGAKLNTITSDEVLDKWHLLEIVMCQWRKIEETVEIPGPFIYSVTRTAWSKVA
jgi:hypothetical protein